MVRGLGRALAVVIALCMVGPASMLLASVSAAVPSSNVVFTESFEQDWPGTLPDGWDLGDANGSSDADFWGRSTYEAVSPTHAAWCAEIGNNSLFGNAPNNKTGLGGNAPKYDVNMDGYMRRPLTGIDSFSSVTVTFKYWAMTGSSTTSLGSDYLWVGVTSSTVDLPSIRDQDMMWRQPADDSSGWRVATFSVPTNSTWLIFNFHSGPVLQYGTAFVGVFIDDVEVIGFGARPPVSRAIPTVSATNQWSFGVSVEIVEHAGSVDHVELYYRVNGTGDWTRYASADNPSGRWSGGTITFRTSSDGRYDLMSVAADRWGNIEPLKLEADASVYVDHGPPSSAASVSGSWGNAGWYVSAVRINITAWDYGGIAAVKCRIDGGPWIDYGGELELSGDGVHKLQYYAIDRASNAEAARDLEVWIDREGPVIDLGGTGGVDYGWPGPTLSFTVVDSGSGVELVEASVDGGPYQEISHHAYAVSLSGLSQGSHSISVRAWDYAGNQAVATTEVALDSSTVGDRSASLIVPFVVIAAAAGAIVLMYHISRRRP